MIDDRKSKLKKQVKKMEKEGKKYGISKQFALSYNRGRMYLALVLLLALILACIL